MSKAFVIKNKEGKYFQWLFNHEPDWEDKLYNGFMHYSKEDAEKSIIQWQLGDCEVVEITIAEGDLEKEIEHWHNLFKQKEQQFQGVRERYHLLNRLQANYDKKDEKLEQQLAEKDKEIEELKDKLKRTEKAMHKEVKEHLEYYNADQKQIRKQVCDEIRDKGLTDQIDGIKGVFISYQTLNAIEQGEQQ